MHLSNIQFIEEMHEAFIHDPESIDPSWRYFFEGMEFDAFKAVEPKGEISQGFLIFQLIDAYRRFGHLKAETNPIAAHPKNTPHQLNLDVLGFTEKDLQAQFPTLGLMEQKSALLKDIIAVLEATYCRTIGIEYMGCCSPELEKWIQDQIEPTRFKPNFSIEKKKSILHDLNRAELFEIFLRTKYVGQKTFSLEGGETLIPVLNEMIELGSTLGVDEVVMGMPHRGRLNVLANILNKSYSMIFSEFEDFYDPALTEGTGDVKYHKGFSSDIETQHGRRVHVGLAANPSHLESVDPIVEGKVLAKQIQKGDQQKNRTLPILIHGDASISGQGVVYETFQLCELRGYGTGGTIHIVVNNQIGFTTLPGEYRSTLYCTDISKTFGVPVFHVNAEDPEECVFAAQLAIQLRQRFHCDVLIDVNCYRKYGHNEGDEPFFTQPLEYQLIRKKKSIRETYREELIKQSVVEKQVAETLEEEFRQNLHFELEELKLKREQSGENAFKGVWESYRKGNEKELFQIVETGCDSETLRELANRFCQIPEGFEIHPKIAKLLQNRLEMVSGNPDDATIDWGMAEHLAFASLLSEGVHVRLSGQDSARGTFTQRHAVIVDQKTGDHYFPLSHLKENQGLFTVYNSPLSEYGILGFEFGYSLSYPSALVMWEAQFGDFANGGQVITDQYITTSEQKWNRYSGLVMLLPHGYEGQGPEHSSARLERFLQLSAELNIQVVFPSTPAQYFHVLRRQIKRLIRKPLIVMTPKALLRHPRCVSSLTDLSKCFYEILDESNPEIKNVNRVLLCSGHVFYDLIAEREKRQITDTAIVRIEQLYPLNHEELAKILGQYSNAKKHVWVQEEPSNMGAWQDLFPTLQRLYPQITLVSRERSASPATGSHTRHEKELQSLMDQAFN